MCLISISRSVTLSNQNVYACLVCGKYFQGRGRSTHAYTHSVQHSHHVFIHLETSKIYCLPDNYEVVDSSLDDIKRALFPSYAPRDMAALDRNTTLARDQYGVAYLPGFVGLNNLTSTDYLNVTLHALAHVAPLRDFFLDPTNYAGCKSPLVLAFGEVIRRLWSHDNFKSAVSPHEFLQAVSIASNKRFHVGQQAECIDFMSWLLNSLHVGLGGSKKKKAGTSIIHKTFQGLVHVHTMTREAAAAGAAGGAREEWESSGEDVPFLHLRLDIPRTPLFKDSQGGNIIPQVSLFTVLSKFDGQTYTDAVRAGQLSRKRYTLRRLPPYLIFHLARFTKNNFFVEKNPTIVNFPVKNLELKDYVGSKSVKELKAVLNAHGVAHADVVERAELEARVRDVLGASLSKYDLCANICHDSPPGQGKEGQMDPLQGGSYRVHVQNRASEQWYEIQDLHVQETMPQLIGLSESYIMIFRRKDLPAGQ
ncbi:hypothetical protein JKP88DRAFT_257423 [Tribonema minus]|uniref:U4/U6.U5 tri-snRNP-associated protein 2 n=1 Tax=Tribonema minus TaxID=303371 RepID=A0A835Z9Q1_9STRA|nr:hypothetical protein JKP88DRAFT_257423 [Tribonema minus]